MPSEKDCAWRSAAMQAAEELRDRAREFLCSLEPVLPSVESTRASWDRLREVSAAADRLPDDSGLRKVRVDPFTVLKPPPQVSEEDVRNAIRRLSAKELKALHSEFDRTCLTDSVHPSPEQMEVGTLAAEVDVRAVHFGDEIAEAEVEPDTPSQVPVTPTEETAQDVKAAATSRATALFETGEVTVDALVGSSAYAGVHVSSAMCPLAPPIAALSGLTAVAPVVSIERRPLSSVPPASDATSDGERGATGFTLFSGAKPVFGDDGNGASGGATGFEPSSQLKPFVGCDNGVSNGAKSFTPSVRAKPLFGDDKGASECATDKHSVCTVDVEGTAHHWASSSTRRGQQENPSPSVHRTASAATKFAGTKDSGVADYGASFSLWADLTHSASDSDTDGRTEESFTTFSRVALSNEAKRRHLGRVEPVTVTQWSFTPPAGSVHEPGEAVLESRRRAHVPTDQRDSDVTSLGSSSPASPSIRPAAAQPLSALDLTLRRHEFVRRRVRDVLLANQVRLADTAALATAFFHKMDDTLSKAADQLIPVLASVDSLLRDSKTLLHELEVLDHRAYRDRVENPAQYLCVPRYRAKCTSLDCSATFSATVSRVTCGRCGQLFCPKCSAERGLGPEVNCDGFYCSLGWEPLCRTCYSICCRNQQQVAAMLNTELLITLRLSESNTPLQQNGGLSQATQHPPKDPSKLKRAVLLGAFCTEQYCLSDGLPPFFVVDHTAAGDISMRDRVLYRLSMTNASVRRGWQNAATAATQLMSSAAHIIKQRRAALK